MSSGDADTPPRPRLTLRVGVTGKREIADAAGTRDSLMGVFDALAAFLAQCHTDHADVLADGKPPVLRIISGMAEGADQIAAEVAIDRFGRFKRGETDAAIPVATRLAAILPFARDEYKKDFAKTPDGRDRDKEELRRFVAHFDGMLGDEAVDAVLEIDDEALLDPRNPKFRNLAYVNLRDVLLEHTDVLVAVSDDVDGGAGGTVDVIRTAMREGIPVVEISTGKPTIHLLRAADPDAPDQTPQQGEELSPGRRLPDTLAAALDRILAPPRQSPPAPDRAKRRRPEEAPVARERLDLFFKEVFDPSYFDRVFKAFRDALTVDRDSYQLLCSKAFAAFRSSWSGYRGKLTSPQKAARELWPPAYDRLSADHGKTARDILAERYGWADSLAVRYADATRSAHIMIAALGALAVLMAVFPLVLPDQRDEVGFPIKAVFLALELAVLGAAAWGFFEPAHKERWHERMVEYRAVAELLRHERFIYALGAADRPGRAADRVWTEPDAWVGWYVRATLRELGFPGKVLSADARRHVLDTFLKDELQGTYGQIAYNRSLDERFHTIDHRLEKIVRWGFWFTFTAAGVGAVMLGSAWWLVLSHQLGHAAGHAVHIFKPMFTIVAAFVPALIAAIHGIRFQIEFKGTARRAGETKEELKKVRDEVVAALGKAPPAPGRKKAVRFVRTANEAMSADLDGWSSVYRSKGPEL